MQFNKLTLALAAMMAGQTLASPVSVRSLPGPSTVTPGGIEDVIVTKQNTLNGTVAGSGTIQSTEDDGAVTIIVENNLAGTTSGQVTAYVIGDVNGSPSILQTDGSWYTLPATSATSPTAIDADYAISIDAEGSSTTFTVPSYLSSGRIYIADGSLTFYTVTNGAGGAGLVEPSVTNPSDPSADVNWGFVEFTNTAAGGMYSNPTYVDFVGLPLGLSLTTTDGAVTSSLGLPSDAVTVLCEALINQTAVDGYPWASLCVTSTSGDYLRVLAPYDYISSESTAFEDYFDDYVSEVWSTYSTTPLIIDTQVEGNSSCTTSGTDTMTCTDSSLTFSKPTAGDIFSCSTGPFVTDGNAYQIAIVPRLCAAFHRATYLLDGGDIQPNLSSDYYYTVSPCNYYSKFVHEIELDGTGYAFSYDDIAPTGSPNVSGELTSTIPESLTITVGGPTSS